MEATIKLIPAGLYLVVGIIALVMAYKSLFAKKLIPFHEAAAGTALDKLDPRLRGVVLALMKTTGLGFLVVALLLLVFPAVNHFWPDPFAKYAVPFLAAIYCAGLAMVNRRLHVLTGAKTPWGKSLAAMLIIMAGIIISIL